MLAKPFHLYFGLSGLQLGQREILQRNNLLPTGLSLFLDITLLLLVGNLLVSRHKGCLSGILAILCTCRQWKANYQKTKGY